MVQPGLWYDGQSAIERQVTVRHGPGGLVIVEQDGTEHSVDPTELVRLPGPSGKLKLGLRSQDGWRLVLTEPIDPTVLAAVPGKIGSLAPTVSRKTMGLLVGISAVATALAGTVIFAPQAIARHMPMSWERKLGAAYDLPLDAMRCSDKQAEAALEQMVDRLDPEARKDGFTIELLDLDEANAAALPGGRMVVFNGLMKDVDHPDALAGIVAHEIAHVRRRHVAAAMVRELGLGTVVALFGGGALASNAGGLASLKFTRSAEAEADADAIAMLERAEIDPRPTARAFDGFRKLEGGWPEWMASHPASGGRAQQFAASHRTDRSYRPVLDEAKSKALMTACRN
jgi:Zn-dependent protease with chaperone function